MHRAQTGSLRVRMEDSGTDTQLRSMSTDEDRPPWRPCNLGPSHGRRPVGRLRAGVPPYALFRFAAAFLAGAFFAAAFLAGAAFFGAAFFATGFFAVAISISLIKLRKAPCRSIRHGIHRLLALPAARVGG